MKHLTISLALLAAASMITPLEAATVGNMADLAPYVFPQNKVATAERPQFDADGLTCLRLSHDHKKIVAVDLVSDKEKETVMDVASTRENTLPGGIDEFIVSPDGSKILVAVDKTPIYRHSYTARWYVYERRTRLLRPLSDTHATQRAPLFSPDGRMVAFVAPDNNIYIRKIDYGTEVAVTRDGAVNQVINGVPDWVYEEEFATDGSMAWAPDCLTLCYLRYDESRVPLYSFPLYEGTCDPLSQYSLYPGSFTYKYPVAGEPNSAVTIHSYDVDNRKTKDIALPGSDIEYIPRIAYGGESSDRLMAVTLDRDQRHMQIYSVNPRSGVSRSVFDESSEAWINPATYETLTFEKDGFVVLSSRTGWTHAYEYSYAGALTATITKGDYDVTAYYGRDLKGYRYVQTSSTGAVNRVVTRIDPKGVARNLSPDKGWASAWFTPSMSHYCLTHSTAASVPVATLYASAGDKKVRVLEQNEAVAARFASAPKPEFLTVTTADGVALNAMMVKPPHFDPSRRYPVILNQYSGPGSQEVKDSYRIDWTMYAALQGYVVITVDPRGTGARGRAWETVVYKNLGHYETVDLRGAARWIASQTWADPSRIGITGWSYGGYETILAVTSTAGGANPFAAAVAIAPVTDWRFYDTIYAERYMLTPQQNPTGYSQSAPLTYARHLDIPLLIMHGTADDNVHLMNTMQYVSVLQSEGRLCDMLLFPNMNHSILGCTSRLSVYSKMLDYFDRTIGDAARR